MLSGLERSISAKLGRSRGAQGAIGERELNALAAVGHIDGPALRDTASGAGAHPHLRRLFRIGEDRQFLAEARSLVPRRGGAALRPTVTHYRWRRCNRAERQLVGGDLLQLARFGGRQAELER